MTTLFLSIFLLSAQSTHATGYGMSIYPPLLKVNIKPGKSISQVFKITNRTTDDKFFVARIVPFTDSDLYGNPVINLQTTAPWLSYFSLANANIKLGEPFSIKGTSSEQLVLGLSIPEDAVLRDIYATLLVSTYANVLDIDYPGSLVSATIGSNMLITINSQAYPPTILKIDHVTPISGSYVKIGNIYLADNITPITFSSTVSNDGDYSAESKGIFRVSRGNNPVHLEGILPFHVLAGTTRNLLNNDGNSFTFSPGLRQLGTYRVTLQVKTDNSNAENSLDIFFFPFKVFAGIILSGLLLFSIIRTTIIQRVSHH